MRVPEPLSTAFGAPFEELISRFATEKALLPEPSAIHSQRFLSRSVIPHIQKLSQLFNRLKADETPHHGLDPYWKESSNPQNLRLAYFLYFMPCNLYRMASVWAELSRLGFQWKASDQLRGVEFGAGPASGACGIAAGEKYAPVGIPHTGNWALIEQDKAMLSLGSEWAQTYFKDTLAERGDWGIRPFHRTIDLKQGLLPRAAPKFNLWLSSYFINEFEESPEKMARILLKTWEDHLEEEGIVILVEPALKIQSRKLLAIRKALIEEANQSGKDWFKILLPCMGHQACGALASDTDWCHEEVSWWRPPYFKQIDQMAGLDRKTLPFSYLVITKSKRSREEILPALSGFSVQSRHRVVSPSHNEGKELEFFICSDEGKRKARYRPAEAQSRRANVYKEIERGDVLLGTELRGDVNSTRIDEIKKRG